MNLNLVDLSNNIKTEFKGQFNDIVSRTTNSASETNVGYKMLDIENKNMNNVQLAEALKILLKDNNGIDIVGHLAKNTGVTADKIQSILSNLANLPLNKKGGINTSKESLQIGDKIEINNTGDNQEHTYAGLLSDYGVNKALKTKLADLEKLLKEKDATIDALKETIELLKNK